jgi:WD40 repeat protein
MPRLLPWLLALGAATALFLGHSVLSLDQDSAILLPSMPLRDGGAEYAYSMQGSSVSLSSDGTVLAVGGPLYKEGGFKQGNGATWVYQYTEGVLTEMSRMPLSEDGATDAGQGSSVSLSSDGSVLAVGGPGYKYSKGATWVYRNIDGAFTLMPGMPLSDGDAGSYPKQGSSVSLSSDGTILAAGGPGYKGDYGATWVYRYDGGEWALMPGTPLSDSDAPDASQGSSVSLSSDGTVLAVAGPYFGPSSDVQGAVWVYRYDGSAWVETAGMPLRGPADSELGTSVSLSSDGTMLAVGGPGYRGGRGAAWVYRYEDGAWGVVAGTPLCHDDGATSKQGASVSLSSDGTLLAVSGSMDGVAWMYYRYTGGAWVEMPGVALRGPASPAVSLSADGTVLTVGVPVSDSLTPVTGTDRDDGSYGAGRPAEGEGTSPLPLLSSSLSPAGPGTGREARGGLAASGGGTWVYATALRCGPGSYLANASLPVACARAPSGYYAPGYTTSYSPCDFGTYSSTPGASSCESCPPGTFGPGMGRTFCLQCPPGAFSSTPGATSCSACPGGTYAETPQSCAACAVFERAEGARCERTGAWYAVFVVVPLLALALLALVVFRKQLVAAAARHRAWREQLRRDRLAGQQLEALLAVHGVKDPDALRAIQVSGWATQSQPTRV